MHMLRVLFVAEECFQQICMLKLLFARSYLQVNIQFCLCPYLNSLKFETLPVSDRVLFCFFCNTTTTKTSCVVLHTVSL